MKRVYKNRVYAVEKKAGFYRSKLFLNDNLDYQSEFFSTYKEAEDFILDMIERQNLKSKNYVF